jgi:hypothetical protein
VGLLSRPMFTCLMDRGTERQCPAVPQLVRCSFSVLWVEVVVCGLCHMHIFWGFQVYLVC